MTPPTEYQELSGRGELHIPGHAPVDVLYFISFLAPLEPPSMPMATGHAHAVAHGHLMLMRNLDGPLYLTTHYVLVLAGGQRISLRLTDNSMGQFDLYAFECAPSELAVARFTGLDMR